MGLKTPINFASLITPKNMLRDSSELLQSSVQDTDDQSQLLTARGNEKSQLIKGLNRDLQDIQAEMKAMGIST
jgi:hypothetical protein